jgi:hypothetical protein
VYDAHVLLKEKKSKLQETWTRNSGFLESNIAALTSLAHTFQYMIHLFSMVA